MTPVRLEPAAPRSRVKHSTTKPLRSLTEVSEEVSVIMIVRTCAELTAEEAEGGLVYYDCLVRYSLNKLRYQRMFQFSMLIWPCTC